jgi:hypothetical protein
LVDERRAAQRHRQHRRQPGAPLAAACVGAGEARGHARVVVVRQEPGGPRDRPGERGELLHRRADRLRVPRLVQEDEVVRQIELVARADVGDEPAQVEQVHLARDHAVAELVDHGSNPP